MWLHESRFSYCLTTVQINLKSVISTIPDPEMRGTMIFGWWMACISDAYGSAYHRRKPILDDDDYNIDFYTMEDTDTSTTTTSPREQLEVRSSRCQISD